VATDREYELEKRLWDNLTVMQQYVIASNTNDTARADEWFKVMQRLLKRWMDDPESYLQHPKWQEVAQTDT
jgi:hypothetical protein